MNDLSDELLVEAYIEANKMRLDSHFIQQLRKELTKRSINVKKLELGNKSSKINGAT